MRFNLKNFPKLWGDEIEYKKLVAWKEGFEAELRELQGKWERMEKQFPEAKGLAAIIIGDYIREILGE